MENAMNRCGKEPCPPAERLRREIEDDRMRHILARDLDAAVAFGRAWDQVLERVFGELP